MRDGEKRERLEKTGRLGPKVLSCLAEKIPRKKIKGKMAKKIFFMAELHQWARS